MKAVSALFACCLAVLLAAPLFASPDQPIVESVEVMKSYAESGDPTAQFNLGLHYTKGDQGAGDFAAGVAWYKRAAQGGFAPAQYNLGVLHANDRDLLRNDKEAVKWLTLAAQQGVFEAQKILIEFYIEGRGVTKNPAAALGWDFIARRTLELRHEQPGGEPPHPPVVRKDGAAEVVMKDGTKKILHPEGGEEFVRTDGTRVITFKDGKAKVISPDGTVTTKHQSGFEETVYPDGRKSVRDPNGTVETTHPDGRKDIEGVGQDKYKRQFRITEKRGKDGKTVSRVVVRGNVTIRENASGPYAVETLLEDQRGVKVKLTEEVKPDGKIGQRKLARADNGDEPKGTEVWTIQREIEPGDGTSILVEETYSSLGLGEQRPIKARSILPPPSPARTADVSGVRTQTIPVRTPVDLPPNLVPPMPVQMPSLGGQERVNVLKEKVDIQPMLKELEDLEMKDRHFAGATEADWAKAKAAAAAYVIPLGSIPQKPGASPSWLTVKQISGATFPVFPFQPAMEDFSKHFPFGLHGREVIKQHPWKHAQTPHFIVHYIEDTDARLSMQFIEGAFSVIGNLLGLDPKRGAQKGHVFLFANEHDWQNYLVWSKKAGPEKNSVRLAGFAYKNELLLPAVSERAGREDSVKTLCHEVTHAIVARFYPGAKPPLWLNEGFAEYVAARTIAIKRGHAVDKYMSTLADRPMKVDEVFRRIRYGEPRQTVVIGFGGGSRASSDPSEILGFYANSAWCVRVLCEKLPPEGFPLFFNALSAGNSPDASFRFAYGAKCPDTKAFAAMVNRIEMPKPVKGTK